MNIRHMPACLLGLAVFALPAPAASGGEAVMLDPVIVTARGYAASQSDTPGGVAVTTSEEIALAPKGSLVDSLERLPGIARTGDSPWGQDISIRGLSGPSVVILLNGKRLNTATDMNARLGFINPADVERIEVLKGPISALYGSGSTGGVVNIITRKAEFTEELTPHGKLGVSASTNPGGADAYGSFSLSGPRAWGFVSASRRDYGNTYGGRDSRVDNSEFADKQGRATLALKPWDALTLTLEGMRSIGEDIGIPGGVSSMPEYARVTYTRTDFSFISLDAALEVNAEYLKSLEANIYFTENRRRVLVDHNTIPPPPQSGATPYPIELRPTADHESWGGKLQALFEAGDHTLVAGADFWTWAVESSRYRHMGRVTSTGARAESKFFDSPTPDAEQLSVGFFAEDNWKLNDALTLNLGLRLDYLNTEADPLYNAGPDFTTGGAGTSQLINGRTDESDLGWHLHAGLTWKMTAAWSQSLLLASGYRAADVMERFKYISLGNNINGQPVALYGNPDLDPERSLYAEYGLRYDEKPLRAELRLFANIVTDYIAEKSVSATRIEMENVEDARIYGAELEARWQFLDNWALFGNATGLYGKDENTGRALPGVAPVSGRAGIDFSHENGFWAKADTFMIAPQRRTPEGVDDTKGVITLNAAAGRRFETGRLKHDVSLVINNILDTRYRNYLAHQRGYTVWETGISASLNYSVTF